MFQGCGARLGLKTTVIKFKTFLFDTNSQRKTRTVSVCGCVCVCVCVHSCVCMCVCVCVCVCVWNWQNTHYAEVPPRLQELVKHQLCRS